MIITSVNDYKRIKSENDKELSTWSKVSWGIFIGSILMAIFLGQWSEYGSDGGQRALVGTRISALIGLALLGAYYWRWYILGEKLEQAFNDYLSTLSESERKSACLKSYES